MKILHLSDIHMDADDKKTFSSMVIDSVNNYCEKNPNLKPDLLLVTGDFTQKGTMSEFNHAKKEIERIKTEISSITNCLIVPGNHDYIWKDANGDVPKNQRHINYEYFKSGCESEGICKSSTEGLSNDLIKELNEYLMTHILYEEDNFAILIIGMNSDILDSSERAGQGYFSNDQHKACKNLIAYYKKYCSKKNKKIVIMAAFHHHILPVSSIERDTLDNPDKFSLTLDARRTLNFFMDNDIVLAMHGHQHQPSIVNWKDEMRNVDKGVYVVSAGSMKQEKDDLGDISKNSFMIYDINNSDVSVYCFQNKNDDWDIMELSGNPYTLMLENPYNSLKCQVKKNSIPPDGIEIINQDISKDTSNLFYLFLNVVDCDEARTEINNYLNNSDEIEVCGIHYLYGKYDILFKYRTDDGDTFSKNLIKYLKKQKVMLDISSKYFVNVSYENENFRKIENIPLIKNPEAYLNSTWNAATLTVYLSHKLSPESFLTELNKSIDIFNKDNNTKIEDIIRNYSIGQDQSIIFELFISCYQFPMLTRFTNLIESIIRKYGIDKSTHIIYYFDERCL